MPSSSLTFEPTLSSKINYDDDEILNNDYDYHQHHHHHSHDNITSTEKFDLNFSPLINVFAYQTQQQQRHHHNNETNDDEDDDLMMFSYRNHQRAIHRNMYFKAEMQRYDGWYNNLAHPSWGTTGNYFHFVIFILFQIQNKKKFHRHHHHH